jgi:hypothetical protein
VVPVVRNKSTNAMDHNSNSDVYEHDRAGQSPAQMALGVLLIALLFLFSAVCLLLLGYGFLAIIDWLQG